MINAETNRVAYETIITLSPYATFKYAFRQTFYIHAYLAINIDPCMPILLQHFIKHFVKFYGLATETLNDDSLG